MSSRVENRPASKTPEPETHPAGYSPARLRLARIDLKYSPYLYIAPFFVVFGIFGAYPLVYTFWVSLHQWRPGDTAPKFIGIDNFTELWNDEQFWTSMANTFGIFVLSTIPQLVLALLVANSLNRRMRGRTFFRMGIALPIVTSTAVVALIFSQLFNKDFGIINWVISLFSDGDKFDWRANRWGAWGAVSLMVTWRWTGYNALIYLAGMQSISKDLYESAEIDGASRRRQFWQITLPMLRPTIIFTVIVSTIGGLQLFSEPVMFSSGSNSMSGGSMHQFQTVTMYMYQAMFSRMRYGYAATVAWVLFLVIVLTSIVNYLITRRLNSAGK